jgi:NadR type nicotinamide-nucleotide adenylyltransferase
MAPRIGLTLGKYAPLHRGHQLVIETALAEMDRVIVLIYDCPETTPVPLTVRARWIRALYPSAEVIEAWDGPTEVGNTPEIKRRHEDYLLQILGKRGVTHFYSSEFYGEHVSQAFGAVNRLVDCKRDSFPISGTAIRDHPFAFRDHIPPLVYRDLITHVVFLGAPSTGKTTLTERMAREFQTVWMPEYGREYWERHQSNRRLTRRQLAEIALRHQEQEEARLLEANSFLFTDTNALTTYRFSLYYHGSADRRLEEMANRCASRYDLVILCGDDIPYDDTWDRSGEENRQVFQKQIIADLIERKIPFFTIKGDLETRVAQVKAILQRHPKYSNPLAPYTGT